MTTRVIILATLWCLLWGQDEMRGQGQALVMPRVDTTNEVVRRIVSVWTDSVQVWRRQALVGGDHDRTGIPGQASSVVRDWFAQSSAIVETFPATVLSVEPEGKDQWVVRTAFSTVDPTTKAVIPLGILRSTVRVTDTSIVMLNPLEQGIQHWDTRRAGSITYRIPPGSTTDRKRIREAAEFTERMAQMFGVQEPKGITYIVARSRDELCSLLGLEYFAFPPQGIAWPSQSVLMVGNGDVAYAHELVHIVLASIDVSHPVIREGVATLFGGSLGRQASTLFREYRSARRPDQIPSFTRLFTEPDLAQDDAYILGAAICQQIVERQGVTALRTLLGTSSRAETMQLVAQWLDIEPGDSAAPLTEILDAAIASSEATQQAVAGGIETAR